MIHTTSESGLFGGPAQSNYASAREEYLLFLSRLEESYQNMVSRLMLLLREREQD
ncbi:MAG: hypothetical protein Ct9H90mP30_1210 [Actinomycetota bacterium]|nr:MAG: hypothetical protein Ct9H90mP30_1210 [Actinomycetota bacterium]